MREKVSECLATVLRTSAMETFALCCMKRRPPHDEEMQPRGQKKRTLIYFEVDGIYL